VDSALLDTDTLSEINKAQDAHLLARAGEYLKAHTAFTFSAVTILEVVRGYHLANRQDKLAAFLSGLGGQLVLGFLQSTAELAGKIDADLLRTGQPIGRADPMIAATAIEHDLVLVTGNTGHFERIAALGYPLKLDNWRS